MIVRRATTEDAKAIYDIGINSKVFRVSDDVPFYEFEEVVSWLQQPADNLFIVAEVQQALVGFLFCKIMSIHWALLDNCYIIPSARRTGAGTALLKSLKQVLRIREVKYLSALFRQQDEDTVAFFKKSGFSPQEQYLWMDVFLEKLGGKSG